MIEAFRQWLLEHRVSIERNGIGLNLSKGSVGLLKNGVSAEFMSNDFEAMIELWETGESEFYFADWKISDRDPDYQPKVVHYDFKDKDEMLATLAAFVTRMSDNTKLPFITDNEFIAGYSESVYFDPVPEKQPLVAAAKGKSK